MVGAKESMNEDEEFGPQLEDYKKCCDIAASRYKKYQEVTRRLDLPLV